jgi:DUF1009 family protein
MPPKLGILAGGGTLPAQIIASCRESRHDFFVIAFEGQTDSDLVEGIPHAWVRLGAAAKAVALLHEAGVTEIVMAGPIRRPSMTQLLPDLWATRVLVKAGPRAFGDDGLLRAIVQELEDVEGFRVVAPESLLPRILAEEGLYGSVAPDALAKTDIERALIAAHEVGVRDQGQGAVVQQGVVLAVEDVAGTDAMLDRCRGLRRDGPGGVLVKIKKPQQEDRVDLPTIGVTTVEAAARAGLRGIAIEAGAALVIDRAEVIAAANRTGLFVIGIQVPEKPARESS